MRRSIWSWQYAELTAATASVESDATAQVRFEAQLENACWLAGNCSRSTELTAG
ncbi:MAG: hypothetical protein J6Y21_01335 [Clostridia bacterium]|nr:hypothetical protein [Clostridia bacterium]